MKIEVLGSCGNQTSEKEAVSFIVDLDGFIILVETGPGIVRQIYRSGRKCSDINAVIVTHSHGDHTCGFPYLMWSMFYDRLNGSQGSSKVDIIGIPSVINGLAQMLNFCYNPSSFPFQINYLKLDEKENSEINLAEIKITSVPTIHTTPNVGIRIDHKNKSIAYSSDTIYSDNFVDLAKNCDFLIHEAFINEKGNDLAARTKHSTAIEAGKAAKNAGAKKLALVHYFPPIFENRQSLIDEASSLFSGDIIIPDEFYKIEL